MNAKPDTKHLESLWATRPVRPRSPRTVAGVCAGIGARYRVDPTLVKVAFVVATVFGGSGIILYLAAWIAFPSADSTPESGATSGDSPSVHAGKHDQFWQNPLFIVGAILAIITVNSIGSNNTWSSGGILGAILMLGGLWLLHQRTPQPPEGTSADSRPTTAPAALRPNGFQRWTPRDLVDGFTPGVGAHSPATYNPTGYTPSAYNPGVPTADRHVAAGPSAPTGTDATPAPHSPTAPAPPSWDPLGAAPFAWDLPDLDQPRDVDTVSRRRRSPLTPIVSGLAILAAVGGFLAHQAGVEWFNAPRIAALALTVVGLGLLWASMTRRRNGEHSTGLVPIAVNLSIVVVLMTAAASAAISWEGIPGGGIGERDWKPLSETDIKPEYSLTMGSATLDLREIDLTTDRTVDIRNGVGEVVVTVPQDMTIRANCSTSVGDYTCPDGLDGPDATDASPAGDEARRPVLTINAHSTIGNVEVLR